MTIRQKQAQNKSKHPPSLQLLDANHHVKVTLGILLNHVSHIVGFPGFLWIQSHRPTRTRKTHTHGRTQKPLSITTSVAQSPKNILNPPWVQRVHCQLNVCFVCMCKCVHVHTLVHMVSHVRGPFTALFSMTLTQGALE